MHKDVKILNKILASQVQQYLKRNNTLCPCGVYLRNARMVYHSKIIQCNSSYYRLRKENHVIISIDEDKMLHPLLLETFSKVGIEGNFLYLIKDIYEKLAPYIILNGEKLRAFLLI